jgi:hypothetical protein
MTALQVSLETATDIQGEAMPPSTALHESERSTRHQAYNALAVLGAGAGRPGAVVRSQFLEAYRCCLAHLQARFGGQLTDDELTEIVERRLVAYVLPLLVPHLRRNRPTPDEILSQLDNAALDRMKGVSVDPAPSTLYWANDATVLARAFGDGVDADDYRFALGIARVLGEKAEFLVATQYLDLLQTTGLADFAEVARKLQYEEQTVRALWWNFVQRLPRRTL